MCRFVSCHGASAYDAVTSWYSAGSGYASKHHRPRTRVELVGPVNRHNLPAPDELKLRDIGNAEVAKMHAGPHATPGENRRRWVTELPAPDGDLAHNPQPPLPIWRPKPPEVAPSKKRPLRQGTERPRIGKGTRIMSHVARASVSLGIYLHAHSIGPPSKGRAASRQGPLAEAALDAIDQSSRLDRPEECVGCAIAMQPSCVHDLVAEQDEITKVGAQ